MKYCSKCNKKIGFFEKFYEEKYCSDCYENIQFEKAELEKKRELERLLLEQKEEKEKKIAQEEKINLARDYFLYINYYFVIIKNIDLMPFHYDDIFDNSIKNKFEVIKLLLDEIIIELPKDFNLIDLKEMTTYRRHSKIIDKVLKKYVKRTLDCEKYCQIVLRLEEYSTNPNNNILDDIETNSILLCNDCLTNIEYYIQCEISGIIKNVKNLQKLIEDCINKSNKPNKYNSSKCIALSKEEELQQTYKILYIYYFYAMIIIYDIYFNRTVDKIIENSELYNIYTKLKNEIHNENYIVQKLFPIYNSLYKHDFDIIFEDENQFKFLIDTIKEREKVEGKNNYIDINSSIMNIDIKNYINIYDDTELSRKLFEEINNNIISYKHYLSISDVLDIFVYSNQYTQIINEIKKQQAINEKERILNGNLEEEKRMHNDLLDYSNITNGYDFETYVANLYSLLGYTIINLTSKSGDQGADVIIKKDNLKYAVQVKFYSNPVGNKAVQEVVAAKSFYKTDKAMVVTNSTFTKQAEQLALSNDVILINGKELEKLKNKIIK